MAVDNTTLSHQIDALYDLSAMLKGGFALAQDAEPGGEIERLLKLADEKLRNIIGDLDKCWGT